MNKSKTLRHMIPVLVLCLIGMEALGQTSIGNRAGITLSSQKFEIDHPLFQEELNDHVSQSTGVAFGIPLEIRLGEHLALQPELGYTMKGYVSTAVAREEVRLTYLDLSLLMKFQLNWDRFGAELFLGPMMGYGLSARSILAENYYFNVYSIDQRAPMENTPFEPLELSGVAGAGLSYSIGVPRLFLNYRYLYGLSNAISRPEIPLTDIHGNWLGEVRLQSFNRVHMISLGIMVPLSRSAWAPTEAP